MRFVEGVTRLAHFLGIKIPVPRGEFESAVLLIDHLLHLALLRAAHSPPPAAQDRPEVCSRLRHSSPSDLPTDRPHDLHNRASAARSARNFTVRKTTSRVVPLAAVTVSCERRLHDAFAECAIFQRRQRRLAGRILQTENKLPFLLLRLGRGGRRRDFAVRKSVQIGAVVDHDRRRILFLQDILLEFRLQRRRALRSSPSAFPCPRLKASRPRGRNPCSNARPATSIPDRDSSLSRSL